MSAISCPTIQVKHLRNGLAHLHSQQKTTAVTRVNSTSTRSAPTTYQSALTMCFFFHSSGIKLNATSTNTIITSVILLIFFFILKNIYIYIYKPSQ